MCCAKGGCVTVGPSPLMNQSLPTPRCQNDINTSPTQLESHVCTMKNREKKFNCGACGEKFYRLANLVNHAKFCKLVSNLVNHAKFCKLVANLFNHAKFFKLVANLVNHAKSRQSSPISHPHFSPVCTKVYFPVDISIRRT